MNCVRQFKINHFLKNIKSECHNIKRNFSDKTKKKLYCRGQIKVIIKVTLHINLSALQFCNSLWISFLITFDLNHKTTLRTLARNY